MIPTVVKGRKDNHELDVNEDGSITVRVSAIPPDDTQGVQLPFTDFFRDDNGNSDLIVDGSVTPQTFCIKSSGNNDIYISYISVAIKSDSLELDNFGGGTELTNGVDFFYSTQELGIVDITRSIKTNLDFYRSATGGDGFGNSDTAFRADTKGGNTLLEYLPKFDLRLIYGLTRGLRLRAESNDSLCITINDDLTSNFIGVGAEFNVIAYGNTRR